MNSDLILREITNISREVTELSLPESLQESPVMKSKNLSPDNRKALVTEKSNDKLKPRSRSPLRRSPSFGSKTQLEPPVSRGPGGLVIPV